MAGPDNPARADARRARKTVCTARPPVPPRAEFQLEGPWNMNDPVHESITQASLQQAGVIPVGVKFRDAPAWEYVRGVIWNDDPQHLLFDEDADATDNWSSGLQFGIDFKRYEAKAGKGHAFGPSSPLLARSHFGDLQFLHAMAASAGEDPTVTRDRISAWAQFCWGVARRETAATVKLFDVEPIRPWFAGTDLSVARLFGTERNGEADKRALGSLLHMLQDSYAGGHVEREDLGDKRRGKIVSFHCYNLQDHHAHGVDDAWGPGGGLSSVLGAEDAVTACTGVLSLFRKQALWQDVADWLLEGPLAFAHYVELADGGTRYER